MREDNVTFFFKNFWCVCATFGRWRDKTDAHLTILHRSLGGSLDYLMGGNLKKKAWRGVRESLKENRRDQIYPRPNCQQTGDTNLFQREDALERLPPDSIILGKYRRKEEKTENKSDFISHHGTWGETKKKRELLLWYVLPRGRLITVNVYK